MKVIKRKLNPAVRFMTHVEALRNSAGNIGTAGQPAAAAIVAPAPADKESGPVLILDGTREVIIAAVLNFIPYAGSTTTLIVLTLVAFVTFDGIGHVVAVAGSYIGLAAFSGGLPASCWPPPLW